MKTQILTWGSALFCFCVCIFISQQFLQNCYFIIFEYIKIIFPCKKFFVKGHYIMCDRGTGDGLPPKQCSHPYQLYSSTRTGGSVVGDAELLRLRVPVTTGGTSRGAKGLSG